jgi:branched-subunit amino acid aminotransferase/4-amino-4-deoxychorismate lyase
VDRATWCNGSPATAAQLESMGLSGYGSYTFFQVRDGAVHGLSLHLTRLRSHAVELFGKAPSEDLLRRLLQPAAASGSCSVRVTLVGPDHDAVLSGAVVQPDVLVTISDPRPDRPAPLSVRTTPYARETPHVKHRGTHGLTRETRTARQAGYDDALLVAADGTVTEGSTWNLLLHDGTHWVWPEAPMLAGVTATLVQAAMTTAGIGQRQQRVLAADLPGFTAGFALNASSPDRAITAVDGRPWPGHAGAVAQLREVWETVEPEPLA